MTDTFYLRYKDHKPKYINGIYSIVGEIKVDGEVESFISPISYWDKTDYLKSWQTSIQRILGGKELSCLIVSLPNPTQSPYIETWPIYRKSDQSIALSNQHIYRKNLSIPFDENNPWVAIEDLEKLTDHDVTDNNQSELISEWQVTEDELRLFLKELSTDE